MKIALCAPWGVEKDGIADYSGYFADGLRANSISVDMVPLGRYIGEREYYKEAARMASKADICHVQFNYPYFNGELPHKNRFISFADNVKPALVMTIHEVRMGFEPVGSGFSNAVSKAVFNSTLPLWNAWSAAFHRIMYKKAARIIVHTGEHRDAIMALVTDADRVVIIPHGIPAVGSADKNMPAAEAKKALGVEGKKTLAIFGFINKRKGYDIALEALSGLPEDVVLLIVGGSMTENETDNKYYAGLIKSISSKGLEKRVRITGYLCGKEIPVVMAAADICLAPFSSSAASGALSLCIGYGKPVVASDTPVHKEINERVPCLELFKNGDQKDLLEKITGLFSVGPRRQALSAAADKYACEYSYEETARTTIELYRSLLQDIAVGHGVAHGS